MDSDPCSLARSKFSDHLDGQPLSFLSRVLVRMHLAICPPCRRHHRSLVATCDALHALRDADVEPEVGGGHENRSGDP